MFASVNIFFGVSTFYSMQSPFPPDRQPRSGTTVRGPRRYRLGWIFHSSAPARRYQVGHPVLPAPPSRDGDFIAMLRMTPGIQLPTPLPWTVRPHKLRSLEPLVADTANLVVKYHLYFSARCRCHVACFDRLSIWPPGPVGRPRPRPRSSGEGGIENFPGQVCKLSARCG